MLWFRLRLDSVCVLYVVCFRFSAVYKFSSHMAWDHTASVVPIVTIIEPYSSVLPFDHCSFLAVPQYLRCWMDTLPRYTGSPDYLYGACGPERYWVRSMPRANTGWVPRLLRSTGWTATGSTRHATRAGLLDRSCISTGSSTDGSLLYALSTSALRTVHRAAALRLPPRSRTFPLRVTATRWSRAPFRTFTRTFA